MSLKINPCKSPDGKDGYEIEISIDLLKTMLDSHYGGEHKIFAHDVFICDPKFVNYQ